MINIQSIQQLHCSRGVSFFIIHRVFSFQIFIKMSFNQTIVSCNLTGVSPLRGSRAALPIACDALNAQRPLAKPVKSTSDLPLGTIMFIHGITSFRNRETLTAFCGKIKSRNIIRK